jgi:hypothetical protein
MNDYYFGIMYMPWLDGKTKPWFLLSGAAGPKDNHRVHWEPFGNGFLTESEAKAEMMHRNTVIEIAVMRDRGYDEVSNT